MDEPNSQGAGDSQTIEDPAGAPKVDAGPDLAAENARLLAANRKLQGENASRRVKEREALEAKEAEFLAKGQLQAALDARDERLANLQEEMKSKAEYIALGEAFASDLESRVKAVQESAPAAVIDALKAAKSPTEQLTILNVFQAAVPTVPASRVPEGAPVGAPAGSPQPPPVVDLQRMLSSGEISPDQARVKFPGEWAAYTATVSQGAAKPRSSFTIAGLLGSRNK